MQWDLPEDAVILKQMAAVIEQLCDNNTDMRAVSPTIFDSVARPTMSVHSYLVRIRRYTKFDSTCFLVAMAYLRLLCAWHGPSFCTTHHNIHRLLITSVLIASKANDDVFHANVFMAQCGGITNDELNKLELEFCERLGWRLMIDPQDLLALISHLDDPSSALWKRWGTEACQQRRRGVSPTEVDVETGASPGHSRSESFGDGKRMSLTRILGHGRSPPTSGAETDHISPSDSKEVLGSEASPLASPRSVLSRNMSFGSFFGSFSALVALGRHASPQDTPAQKADPASVYSS